MWQRGVSVEIQAPDNLSMARMSLQMLSPAAHWAHPYQHHHDTVTGIYSGEYSLSILYNGCDIVICDVVWRGLLWNVAERLDTRRFNAQRFVKINNSATVVRCLSPVRSLLKILAWPGLAIVMQSVANTSVDIKVKPGYPH